MARASVVLCGPETEEQAMALVEQMCPMEHSVEVAAPADTVYGVVADVAMWPLLLPQVVHVEPLPTESGERLLLWAADDRGIAIVSCESRRTYEPQHGRITFHITFRGTGRPAGDRLTGSWTVAERTGRSCVLTLRHEAFRNGVRAAPRNRSVPPDPATGPAAHPRPPSCGWTHGLIAAIGRLAEDRHTGNGLTFGFEQEVRVKGPAELALAFLYRAADWPGPVPHRAGSDAAEPAPGVRVLAADLRDAHGTVRTTRSVRLCFPHAGRVVHKQTAGPLVAGHAGEWSLLPDEHGATLRARHSVLLRADAARQAAPGPDTELTRARSLVRDDLVRRSRALLERARIHAESAVRVL